MYTRKSPDEREPPLWVNFPCSAINCPACTGRSTAMSITIAIRSSILWLFLVLSRGGRSPCSGLFLPDMLPDVKFDFSILPIPCYISLIQLKMVLGGGWRNFRVLDGFLHAGCITKEESATVRGS